jgi:hypothetical protein
MNLLQRFIEDFGIDRMHSRGKTGICGAEKPNTNGNPHINSKLENQRDKRPCHLNQ